MIQNRDMGMELGRICALYFLIRESYFGELMCDKFIIFGENLKQPY
jgi:hypothetical protein